VTMSTCGSGFDTSLFVYEGCNICPNFETDPVVFNDDDDSCGSSSQESSVTFDAIAGDCFRIRVGDQSGTGTIGDLNISCAPVCPSGEVNWIDPPQHTVDAGHPWLSTDSTRTQVGITKITVEIVPDGLHVGGSPTDPGCWDICENDPLNGLPVGIQSIFALPNNQYEITLTRPLTARAATTFEYLGNQSTKDFSRITTHPGNVDGNITAAVQGDIVQTGGIDNLLVRLRFFLDPNPPFILPPLQGEPYSLDIDRSGNFGPLDLLDIVDLMNGSGEYLISTCAQNPVPGDPPICSGTAIPESPICPNN